MTDHNIDKVRVQEHRYHHSEEDIKYDDTGNGYVFDLASAGKNSANAMVRDVGMLLGPQALKSFNSEKIQPRMMVVMFNSNPSMTIISCYSPTNASDETDLDTVSNELTSLVHSIPKQNILIIGGDMNVQIGKNVNNKFSLHNLTNRNGEHLTDFPQENGLACLNTKFQ